MIDKAQINTGNKGFLAGRYDLYVGGPAALRQTSATAQKPPTRTPKEDSQSVSENASLSKDSPTSPS